MPDEGIHILVIDGEGSPTIGVVSSVDVLDEMMSRIAFDSDTPEDSILPCHYFDLIVGSGDGGWIALMLGRLGMSISRAKAEYQKIHSFIHHNCASLDPKAKAEQFEVLLKKLVCEETGEVDPELEKLQKPSTTKPHCKVAVLTKASLNIGAPIVLRTYRVRDNKTPNCPVWAAMRACTARPNVFPEVLLSGRTLISASLGHNNPIDIAMHEALAAFPNARIDCIVSLGSGHPGHTGLQSAGVYSLAKVAMELAQSSELVSQEFAKRWYNEGRGNTYFRFNVQQGLQAYAQVGYDSALSHTMAYLQDPAVGDTLNAAIGALRGERHDDTSAHQPLSATESSTSGIIHASNAPPIQTYAYALYEEGFGLPLWDPQPLYEAKPVEIGDIGILTKLGAFQVLFNATLPTALQTAMGYRIPPDFEPISIVSSDITLDPDILRVPFLAHGDVIPRGQGLDSLNSTKGKIQKPFKLSFAAMNGAALVIKDPPTEIALTPERKIEEYIRKNCRSWYHYLEHDPQGPRRNLHGSSLIFVTAVIQNSHWALGAWSSLATPIEVSYSGSATSSNGKILDMAGHWTPPGRRDVKQGPTSTRGTVRPKLREQKDSEIPATNLTQTLFLRGYVIGVRDTRPEILEPSKVYPLPYKSWWEFLQTLFTYGLPPILRAAAEPRDLPPPPPPPTSPAVPADESPNEDGTIMAEPVMLSSPRQLRHPADDIIDNMFKMDPTLDLIILHDDTIVDLMRHQGILQKEHPVQLHETPTLETATIKTFQDIYTKPDHSSSEQAAISNPPNDLFLYLFPKSNARVPVRDGSTYPVAQSMSKDGQDVKHYDIATRASLKILLVDKVSTNEESPAGYKLGGYLPIKVSDSFKSGRYEVVRKLGWGHFSTVWLVKDTQAKRHSALKVVKSAPKYAEIARDEIKLLSRLSMASPSHPGRDHIVSFLDSFSHLGPQSSHICIVFEPMGETLLSLIERNKKMGVPLNLVKIITKQVLLGLQYLHDECDLVHTDIKPENILISIPNVEEYICNELLHPPPLKYGQVDPITNPESREGTPTPQNLEGSTQRVQIWESQPLRSPSLSFGSNTPGSSPSEVSENVDDTRNLPLPFKKPGTVSPTLGTIPPSPPATPAPQYVTPIIQPESPSTPVRPPYDTPLPSISVKIADLGNATPSQKHFSEDIQTRQYRAPECILGRKDWDTRVDVWSVACLVFELLTAEYLFDPQEYTELFTKDDDHMAQIIELIGDFPVEVKMGGKYSREIFDHTGALRYIKTLKPWPLHEVMNRKYGWSEVDSALFSNFALPMLAPDMHQRVHARDIINHPWLEVDPSTLGGGSTHPIPSKSGLDAEKPSQVRHHNSRPSSNYLPTTTTTTRQSRALTVLPRRHFHSRSSTTSCSRLRSSVSVSRSRTPAYQPSVSPNLTVSI